MEWSYKANVYHYIIALKHVQDTVIIIYHFLGNFSFPNRRQKFRNAGYVFASSLVIKRESC